MVTERKGKRFTRTRVPSTWCGPPHPSEYLIFHMLSSFDEILLKVNVLQEER